MYIENIWAYIGGSDDSLTLLDYLAEKPGDEISLGEIFSDFGLDKMNGGFRAPETPCVFVEPEGWEMEIHFAVDLLCNLAALVLECKVNGTVDLGELMDGVKGGRRIRLTASAEEHRVLEQTLTDFAAAPEEYEISEMMSGEELAEMAQACGTLRRELYP